MSQTTQTTAIPTASAQISISALADQLFQKQSLSTGVAEESRDAAMAEAYGRVAKRLSANNNQPDGIMRAIVALCTLAGRPSAPTLTLWLAIRGLQAQKGDRVQIIGGEKAQRAMATAMIAGVDAIACEEGHAEATLAVILGAEYAAEGLDRAVATDPAAGAIGLTRALSATFSDAHIAVLVPGTLGCAPSEFTTANEAIAAIDALPIRPGKVVSLAQAAARKSTVNGRQTIEVAYEAVDWSPIGDIDGAPFERYRPARMVIHGAKPHPEPLVESSTMASVPPPLPTYRLRLPAAAVDSGALSEEQIETATYAAQAHQEHLEGDPDDGSTPPRQGFFVGCGTGTGKARIALAVLMDRWLRQERRHIWITERDQLFEDVAREWQAIGGRSNDVFRLSDFPADAQLPPRDGVMFLTYALLRGREDETNHRLEQILAWLRSDPTAAIVFDEAHNLRNAAPEAHRAQPSLQGQAALTLQRTMPDARVLYMSATGATEIDNLAYAIRLGLWGRWTPFPNRSDFVEQMGDQVTKLEAIACDLKQRGLYAAYGLSLEGIRTEVVEHKLTQEQETIHDAVVDVWDKVVRGFRDISIARGLTEAEADGGRLLGLARAHLWGTQYRLFRALQNSFKTERLISLVREKTELGDACVIQLVSTYEANLDKAIESQGVTDPSGIDTSPRSILLSYVDNISTQKITKTRNGKKLSHSYAFDANGQPIISPEAVAAKAKLRALVEALPMPPDPLDQLFRAFGSKRIAEVTGRSKRVIPDHGENFLESGGKMILETRSSEDAVRDIHAFRNDEKHILVFSNFGGVGASYHASKEFRNKRQRWHILFDGGDRADVAIQGLGRTHRSGQVRPPRQILMTTNLRGEKADISKIARTLENLGALTHGSRQASSNGLFNARDNLEDGLAQRAFEKFLASLCVGAIPGLPVEAFERETYIKLRNAAGKLAAKPELRRFLVRLKSMKKVRQDIVFDELDQRITEEIIEAVKNGTYERGIETLRPKSLVEEHREEVARHRSGATTIYHRLVKMDPITPVAFADIEREVREGIANARMKDHRPVFGRSLLDGRVAAFFSRAQRMVSTTEGDAEIINEFRVVQPRGESIKPLRALMVERWKMITADEARPLWEAEVASLPTSDRELLHVISGAMLPVWDRLRTSRAHHAPARVIRMNTDDGRRILGRVIEAEDVPIILRNLGAKAGEHAVPPAQASQVVLQGGQCELANGWFIESSNDGNGISVRIMLNNPGECEHHGQELIEAGAQILRKPGAIMPTVILPSDPSALSRALARIAEYRPITAVSEPAQAA